MNIPVDIARDIYAKAVQLRNDYVYNIRVEDVSLKLCDIFQGINEKLNESFVIKECGHYTIIRVEHVFCIGKNTKYVTVEFGEAGRKHWTDDYLIKCNLQKNKWELEIFDNNDGNDFIENFTFYDSIIYSFLERFNHNPPNA